MSQKAVVVKSDQELLQPVERGFVGKLFYQIGTMVVRIGSRFELRGVENLPADAPFIIAPNHETYVDGMLASMGLDSKHRKLFCSLAAKELLTSHGPFGRLIMKVGRGIPIDRQGSSIHSLKTCINLLNEGNILMIHPEGTRTKNGTLGRIRDGSAFIAKQAAVPIIPCFIDGGFEIFSRHMKFPKLRESLFRRKRLIVSYGEPIIPADYSNTKEITAALAEWYKFMYENKEVPRTYEGANARFRPKTQA